VYAKRSEAIPVDKQGLSLSTKAYFFMWNYFWWVAKLAEGAQGIFQGCFVGLWLGLLTKQQLEAVDQEFYRKTIKGMPSHHNFYSKKYNRSGLFAWEQRVLSDYFGDCRRLLLYGAGGGRDTLALKRLGHHVEAFEANPDLVAAANELLREEGYDAAVQLVSRDECHSTGPTYDGIIVSYGTYGYIQGRKRRIRLLRQLRAQTQAQCPIFVSFNYRARTTSFEVSLRLAALLASIIRRALRREQAEVGDWLDPIYLHYLTQDELASELLEGGFSMLRYNTTEYGHAVGIAI
jgi:hypothetical protein